MKQTRLLMGMPVTVEIIGLKASQKIIDAAYDFFAYVDETYSPFKPTSEVSRINAGLPQAKWSDEMRAILALCEQTKKETGGYFDAWHDGVLDPSGLVKGWAI